MPRSSASGESRPATRPPARSAGPRTPARHPPPARPGRPARSARSSPPARRASCRRSPGPAARCRSPGGKVLQVPGRDRQRHPSKACSWRRTASRSHPGSSPESSTLRRSPSSAATIRRTSSSGACRSTRSPSARSPRPHSRCVRRARRLESAQLDLQAVERDRDVALGRHLLDQPVRELLGPGGGVELGVAEPVGDRGDARRPRARRSSAARPRGCRPWSRNARWSRTARRPPRRRRAVGDGGDALARDDRARSRRRSLADPL